MCLRHNEVYFTETFSGGYQLRHIGPQEVAELRQDLGDLPGLGEVQFTDFVFQLDDFRGLYERSLAGGRFVENESLDSPLECGIHREKHLAFPYRYSGVTVDVSVLLRFFEDGIHPLGDGAFLFFDLATYLVKSFRSGVLDVSGLVQYEVDPSGHFGKDVHLGAHSLESRIYPVLYREKEMENLPRRFCHRAELTQRMKVYI